MTTILYLFGLKPGVERLDYETWARTVDLPALRGLSCVHNYRILRRHAVNPPGDDGIAARASYIEILDVTSSEQFDREMAAPAIVDVASRFREYAATPTILVLEELDHSEADTQVGEETSAGAVPNSRDQLIQPTHKEQMQ
jgi:hypothetical protein